MAKSKLNLENPAVQTIRHVSGLEVLYKISRILAAGTQRKQALAEVLDILEKELGLNRGTITLLSPDGNEIRIEVAHSFPEERSRGVRYRMGEGVTGKVMQTGKAMIVPKVSEEPLFLNRFERWNVAKEDISFICVPILSGYTKPTTNSYKLCVTSCHRRLFASLHSSMSFSENKFKYE